MNNEKRYCQECNVELTQKKNESKPRFLAKRYCSVICSKKTFAKEGRGWFAKKKLQTNFTEENAGRKAYNQEFSKRINNYE